MIAIATESASIGPIRSVSWRAAAAGPTKTATTSRLPRPWTATTIAIAILAGVAGLYLSYYAGTAGGASVALAIVAAYLLSQLRSNNVQNG